MTFSMLKRTLRLYDHVDLEKYLDLRGFLSNNSKGYELKKSKVLTEEQTAQFLQDSSDDKWLDVKASRKQLLQGFHRYNTQNKNKILEQKQNSEEGVEQETYVGYKELVL